MFEITNVSPMFNSQESSLLAIDPRTMKVLKRIQVTQRSEGQTVPFEEVRDMLAEHLTSLGHGQSLHQFLHLLVEQADIQGVDMTDALVPLQG